ncbi:MAG: cyclophilin-like fold protein [Acetatifactor muris]|nr:cyclophilin-like fold protein [Acetatifactor muris]
MRKKLLAILGLALASGMMLAGCAGSGAGSSSGGSDVLAEESPAESDATPSLQEEGGPADAGSDSAENEPSQAASELSARFGYEGESFTLHLYDNDTAAAIARHVGTSDWNLPIYNYEGFDNWEVMQYYDIPSRYEIPSAAEEITEEKAGEVYYSEPNRIILFYHDAEVPAEYTPVGYFDATEDFVEAVENNPVLEGWGNKIISISDGEDGE